MSEVKDEINIYCDESCHLQNEQCQLMIISCLRCPKEKVKEISNDILNLKRKHGIWKYGEIKWTKVSKSKQDFYLELFNYFIKNPDLRFRAIVIDKSGLNHPAFKQSHNTWFYKMIYNLVDHVLEADTKYNIYTDKKENSYEAKKELAITGSYLQQRYSKLIKVQNITSHQSQIMQLNDFLQGAVSYYNRMLLMGYDKNASIVKKAIAGNINQYKDLTKTNYDTKFNIFVWEGRKF